MITGSSAPADRRAELAQVADVVVAGGDRVDVVEALRQLRALGCAIVLCEGGPTLNAQLLGAGLVDEVCATIGPMLVGGSSKRMIEAATPDSPEPLRLDRLLEEDSVLLARYVRG